ncbi:MAG: hypothetical protein K6U10_11395, partial [Acidobacteriia bacterium]|nr:hypothetical protein [Terriglobia bacterium]
FPCSWSFLRPSGQTSTPRSGGTIIAALRQRQEHGAETDARLPLVTFHGRTLLIRGHLFFEGIHKEPDFYVNRCYAKAMGVRTVQGFSQQK